MADRACTICGKASGLGVEGGAAVMFEGCNARVGASTIEEDISVMACYG